MKAKLVALAGLLTALPVFAHHSFAMFELTKDVTYEGTVLEYRWENPHTHVIVKVDPGAADPATAGTWDIEGGATNIMGRQGWTRRRSRQDRGPSYERRKQGCIALLCDHARWQAAVP